MRSKQVQILSGICGGAVDWLCMSGCRIQSRHLDRGCRECFPYVRYCISGNSGEEQKKMP